MKETNIYIMKFIEEEKRERRRKLIKRKMIERFLNLGKGVDIPIHKAERLLSKISSKKVIPKYITSKSKVKDKKIFLKEAREKQLITYNELSKDYQQISHQKASRP